MKLIIPFIALAFCGWFFTQILSQRYDAWIFFNVAWILLALAVGIFAGAINSIVL